MAVHVHLKDEFTEDEKYHNLMRWFNLTSRGDARVEVDSYMDTIWTESWTPIFTPGQLCITLSLVMRKPVFRVCKQVRLKLACSAAETN